jgi:hypothetical protein
MTTKTETRTGRAGPLTGPSAAEWERFLNPGRPDEYDHDREAERKAERGTGRGTGQEGENQAKNAGIDMIPES